MSEKETSNPYEKAQKVVTLKPKGNDVVANASIDHVPEARYRYVLMRVVAGVTGENNELFPPPEVFSKSNGGIIISSTQMTAPKLWCTNVYEIVGLGDGVKDAVDQTGMRVGENLKVGQWVTSLSVSTFTFMNVSYAVCSPEYITSVVKEPEVNSQDLIDLYVKSREQ